MAGHEPRKAEESAWIKTCLAGDTAGFRPLVERYQGAIFRIALRMVGDKVEAEDVTQDVFLKAFAALKRYEPRWAFSTWLYRIAVNTCVDRLRARRDVLSETVEPAAAAEGTKRIEQRELSAAVRDALHRLPPTYRAALVLKDIEGLDYRSMAEILEEPIATLKMRVVRGRAMLADKVQKMYPDLASLV